MNSSYSEHSLQGKVAIVTGASRGIGRAVALELANRGANIGFNYLRSHEAASDTQRDIESIGVRCIKVQAHLGDSSKIPPLFDQVYQEFGRLDILVNNAASGVQKTLEQLDEKHWDWTMDINAKAPWLCSKEAAKLMTSGGYIVNITSEGSRTVLPYYFSVGTSKAALEAITRYLAVELAPKGIVVNAVSGGYVATDALEHFPNKEEMLSNAKRNPSKKMVTQEDIAKVVAFLCSKDAKMILGQIVVEDGGATLAQLE